MIFFWLGQNRDGVRLEAGAEGLAGFELALEDEGWEGEFLFWEAKEDSGWPAPGTCRGFLGQAGGALELAAGKHYRCDTANAEVRQDGFLAYKITRYSEFLNIPSMGCRSLGDKPS